MTVIVDRCSSSGPTACRPRSSGPRSSRSSSRRPGRAGTAAPARHRRRRGGDRLRRERAPVERGRDAQPLPGGRRGEPRRPAAQARPARTRLRELRRARAGVDLAARRPRAAPAALRGAAVPAPRRRARPAGRAGPFNDYRFPSKLPEFLATGRPVVLPATNLGRFLDDGEECLLLRRGDALEIAAAVERLLDDDELRARLGRGGRAFAERNFSWPASARKLAALRPRARRAGEIGAGGARPPRSDTRPAAAPPAG